MTETVPHEILATGFSLTEGPRFDDEGRLWFGDVIGHGLYRWTETSGVEAIDAGRLSVGGVVGDEDGGMICSGRAGLLHIDPKTGATSPIPVAIDGVPVTNINDIEADPFGNLWGGVADYEAFERGEPPRLCPLFRLSTDGHTVRLAEMPIPNGMEFRADGRQLILSESTEGVFVYDVAADGTLSNRTLFAAMPDSDGIAMDRKGGLWVTRYFTNTIEYFSAEGRLERRIALPFSAVASVTFGGPDLTDLYVVGGELKLSDRGGVLRFPVETPGLPPRKTRIGGLRAGRGA